MSSKEHSLIAYNAFIQILGRVLFLILSFLNIKLITSYLTPNLFGEYATIITYTGFFTVLIDLGLFTVAVREIAKDKSRQQEIMSNVLTLRLMTAIIATLLAIIIGYNLDKYAVLGPGIILASVAMFVYFIANILDVVFHVNLKMQYISLSENISKIFTLVFVFLTVKYDLGFLFIITSILVGNLVAVIPRIILARQFIDLRLKLDPKVSLWIIKLALPLGIVFILNNIYFKIDSQMLYLLSTTYDAGLYGIAFRIMETTIFVAAFITAALTPSLSRLIIQEKAAASHLISRAFEVLLAAALLLFATVFIFAPEIILLLSDSSYLQASDALKILAAVAALMYLNSLLGQILIAADKRKILIIFSIILVLFNIILNWFLIPVYGFIGAAWATLISELGILIFNLIVSTKIIVFSLDWRRIIYILFSTLVLGLVYLLFKNQISWLITIILGLIVYLTIIWQAKFLNWQTIKEIVRSN